MDSNLPCKHVYRFNTNNPEEGLKGCPKILKKRAYPAVVSLGGKIYVFGGFAPFKEDSSPWAEFLDTNKPKEEQEWKALKDPIFPHSCSRLGCTQLFAFPYDAQTILIGCGVLPNEDAFSIMWLITLGRGTNASLKSAHGVLHALSRLSVTRLFIELRAIT